MPWYPKAVVLVVAALALAILVVRPLREGIFRVDMRWLVSVHLVRFIGLYFLYLYARHELPYGFAVWGGWGDILVASLALVVMLFPGSKPVLVVWNILGLADILAVAATAARSEIAVPGSMHQLDKFPLILLPTFIVPVIIVTHVLMLARLLRNHSS